MKTVSVFDNDIKPLLKVNRYKCCNDRNSADTKNIIVLYRPMLKIG